MRIFLAGATGLIGVRLLPLMTAEGFHVGAMTRSPEKIDGLRGPNVTPVLCDIFDCDALIGAVGAFGPDVVMHQVTDLPDHIDELPNFIDANARVRSEGTQNLLAAARAANAGRVVAQSIAWSSGPVVKAHEQAVLADDGVILRYGQFYGPNTYYEGALPAHPRVHIDRAAMETMTYLNAASGVYEISDSAFSREDATQSQPGNT